jgi:YVTN family beta-propeller protein
VPAAIAVDAQTHHAFVANSASGSVSVLDTRNGAVLRTVRVGRSPLAIAVAAAQAFVLSRDHVSVLDARSGRLRRSLPVGGELAALSVDATHGRLFVIDQGRSSVSLLDMRHGRERWRLVRHLKNKRDDLPLAISAPLSRHVFVAWGSNNVSMLDVGTGKVLRTVRVGGSPLAIAVDAKTHRAFVANSADGTVSVVDAGTCTVLRTVKVGKDPSALGVDQGAGRVYVANKGSRSIGVLDAKTGAVRRVVPVGKGPVALAMDGGGRRVVVVNNPAGASHGSVTIFAP